MVNTRCVQKVLGIFVFSKKYLFIRLHQCGPLQNSPPRYNTLMPAFFPIFEALLIFTFWHVLEHSQRFGFYFFNRGKTPSFHGSLRLWEQEKVTRSHIWYIWGLGHDYGIVFGQKNYEQATANEHVRYRGAKAMNCFSINRGVFFGLLHANVA